MESTIEKIHSTLVNSLSLAVITSGASHLLADSGWKQVGGLPIDFLVGFFILFFYMLGFENQKVDQSQDDATSIHKDSIKDKISKFERLSSHSEDEPRSHRRRSISSCKASQIASELNNLSVSGSKSLVHVMDTDTKRNLSERRKKSLSLPAALTELRNKMSQKDKEELEKLLKAIEETKEEASKSTIHYESVESPREEPMPEVDIKEELEHLQKKKKVTSTIGMLEKLGNQNFMKEKLNWMPANLHLSQSYSNHTCESFGDALVLIGGVEADNAVTFIDPVHNAINQPKLTGAKNAPKRLLGHTCSRIGSKFYIIGGIADGTVSNKVFIVSVIDDDTVHWSITRIQFDTKTSTGIHPRVGHSTSRFGSTLIVFGGYAGTNWLNEVGTLETGTMKWQTKEVKGDIPNPRCGHTSTIIGNKLIIFGGCDGTQEYNDLHTLDLDTMIWTKIEMDLEDYDRVPFPRSYHSMTRIGDNLFIYGGTNGNNALSDFWVLSKKFIWSKVSGTNPGPRSHQTVTRVGTKLYLLGGKTLHNQCMNDIWVANTVELPLCLSIPVVDPKEFKFEHEVASGNFAKVFKGSWKEKEVAIKKLTIKKEKDAETHMKEFKAEVEMLGQLSHPNLVAMLGYSYSPMLIVMEYLPYNLHDLIQSETIDQPLRLQFATEIAEGMRYLHSKDILHRDLKSFNILIDINYNVKIGDFGIARVKTVTSTLTTIGTIAWTAPEVLRHESYNEKCDVYSYAIVLWECLTGKIPYEDMEAVNAGIAVASEHIRPDIPEGTDPQWVKLIQWCWSEDPSHRPSFEEVLKHLKETF